MHYNHDRPHRVAYQPDILCDEGCCQRLFVQCIDCSKVFPFAGQGTAPHAIAAWITGHRCTS